MLLLVAVNMVPTMGGIALIVATLFGVEEARVAQARIETARALMQVVDRELAHAQGILRALSASSTLQDGDLRAFYAEAKAVGTAHPDNNFVLSDASGQQLLNTLRPYGDTLPRHGNPEQLHRVFSSGKPVVSDLYLGGVTRHPVISIDVPVLRHGKTVFDLSMGFLPLQFFELLHTQRIAANHVAAIFDSRGVIVARTWEQDRYVGRSGAAGLVQRMREVSEGSAETVTLEGVPVDSAFSRSAVSGWSVAIGVPRNTVQARWASLKWVLGVAAMAMMLGLALAAVVAGRISDAVRALRPHAKALGEGAPVSAMHSVVEEVDELALDLEVASQRLLTRTVQRDRAEQAERDLRSAQEQLVQSENFQRRLFEEAPDAMLLVDANGVIVRANGAAERVFGYTKQELQTSPVDRLVPATHAARHAGQRADYFQHPVRRTMAQGRDLFARRADGSEFAAEVALSPIGEGSSRMALATIRDVSLARRNEAITVAALREKEILLKEVYHRVKNNLQVIASMVRMQGRACSNDATRIALEETAGRVRAMALVHEKLYQSGDLSSIALNDYIADLCRRMGDAAGACQRGIAIECQMEPVTVGLEVAIPLGLILNELVSNCLKHAFPGGRHGQVIVRLEQADARLSLSVADDGVGRAGVPAGTTSSPLGLRLVTALSGQLGGEFSISDNGGMVARLVMPCADASQFNQTRKETP